jgi:hypothetical protein
MPAPYIEYLNGAESLPQPIDQSSEGPPKMALSRGDKEYLSLVSLLKYAFAPAKEGDCPVT